MDCDICDFNSQLQPNEKKTIFCDTHDKLDMTIKELKSQLQKFWLFSNFSDEDILEKTIDIFVKNALKKLKIKTII